MTNDEKIESIGELIKLSKLSLNSAKSHLKEPTMVFNQGVYKKDSANQLQLITEINRIVNLK